MWDRFYRELFFLIIITVHYIHTYMWVVPTVHSCVPVVHVSIINFINFNS